MRLHEFTTAKDYTAVVANTKDEVNQLEKTWPHDDLPFVLDLKRPQGESKKDIEGL